MTVHRWSLSARCLFGSEALAKQLLPDAATRARANLLCVFGAYDIHRVMSLRSSSSPEPEPPSKSAKKAKDRQKKLRVSHPAAVVDEHGKNEGDDVNWDYKPPEGFVLMKHKVEESDFDWDAINNDDNLELWVVRVPEGVSVCACVEV